MKRKVASIVVTFEDGAFVARVWIAPAATRGGLDRTVRAVIENAMRGVGTIAKAPSFVVRYDAGGGFAP